MVAANTAERRAAIALTPYLVASLEPGDVPTSLDGRAVATPWTPPTAPGPVCDGALEPSAIAAAWNAANVLLPVVGALILPTIPRPQWDTCVQWNQMGCVSVTLIVKIEDVTKPESKPAGDGGFVVLSAARYVQGAANDDWVTECAREAGKKKLTMVPTGAVMLAGLKTKFPLKPTSTFMVPLLLGGADGVGGGAELAGAGGGPP